MKLISRYKHAVPGLSLVVFASLSLGVPTQASAEIVTRFWSDPSATNPGLKRKPSSASDSDAECASPVQHALSPSRQVSCGRWSALLSSLQTFDLIAQSPSDAADFAIANLATVPPTHDNLETAAACTESRMPVLADPHYAQKFYRFKDGPLWMLSALQYLAKMGKHSFENLFTQYRDLKQFRADSDAALIAAISFRESGTLAWTASDALIDTHLQGGLDFLGANLGMVRAHYLPPGYGAHWDTGRHAPNESGQMSWAAKIPQHDLPVAYGAWILYSKDQFEKIAKKYGFSQCDLDAMSIDARRAWTALFFAAAGGFEYDKPHDNNAASIGGTTVLTHLIAILADKKAHGEDSYGLEEILSNPSLYIYTDVRLSMAVVANAAILEMQLGLQ
jgi:hypothetical protein